MAEKYIFKRVRAMPKQKKASFGRHIQKKSTVEAIQRSVEKVPAMYLLEPLGSTGANRVSSESLGSPDAKSFVGWDLAPTPPALGTKRSTPCPSWNSLVALTGTNGEPVDLF